MKARVTIQVQPRSPADAVAGESGGVWKLRVQAPPAEGKANDACVAFFARGLKVPRAAVRIVTGRTARRKLVEVDGVTQEALECFLREQSR